MPEIPHKLFRYEPATGRLVYQRTGREITGPYRRRDLKKQYAVVQVAGRQMPAHRLIWALCKNQWPDRHLVIDHINGDPTDNRIANLRLVSIQENTYHAPKLQLNIAESLRELDLQWESPDDNQDRL